MSASDGSRHPLDQKKQNAAPKEGKAVATLSAQQKQPEGVPGCELKLDGDWTKVNFLELKKRLDKESDLGDYGIFASEGERVLGNPPTFKVHRDEARAIFAGLSNTGKIGLQSLSKEQVERYQAIRPWLVEFIFPDLASIVLEYQSEPLEFGFGSDTFARGLVMGGKAFVFLRGEPNDHILALHRGVDYSPAIGRCVVKTHQTILIGETKKSTSKPHQTTLSNVWNALAGAGDVLRKAGL